MEIRNSETPVQVVISDIDMLFGSMVRLMVKMAIAAIPAAIIITVIYSACIGIITGMINR